MREKLYTSIWERYGPPGDPYKFLQYLLEQMRQHHITQQALADRAGISPTQVNRWLRWAVVPSLQSLVILDEALDQIVGSMEGAP